MSTVVILGNIIYFSDSRLSAPEKIHYTNDHFNSIQKDINSIKNELRKKMDADFFRISDMIELSRKELFITNNERDILLNELTSKYLPWFFDVCRNKFKNSYWDEQDHVWMMSRINLLRGLRIKSNSERLIESDSNMELTKIAGIIEKYRKALEESKSPVFVSIEQSRSYVANIATYMADSNLKYCKNLKVKLEEGKLKLNDSHFQYLEKRVNQLDTYRMYEIDSYRHLYQGIMNDIQAYNENAFGIYGVCSSTSYLARQADEKFNKRVSAIEKNKQKSVRFPKYLKTDNNKKCLITEVELHNNFTRVEISYTAHIGEFINISRATYLQVDGSDRKFFLDRTTNIPFAPQKKKFDRPYFDYRVTLYFTPVPLTTDYINLIEDDGEGRGWVFRNIQIK